MHCAADTMRGAADMMAQWVRPPLYGKNKLLSNQYLGIFMHFESIFFFFFNLENGLFQTHPPTKSGKFQTFFFFLNPSLSVLIKGFILESSMKFRDYAKTFLLLPDVRRIPSADIILQEKMTNK